MSDYGGRRDVSDATDAKKLARALVALRYIACPTMSYPGRGVIRDGESYTPAEWARSGKAWEPPKVLATCIDIATMALEDIGEDR